MSIKTLMGNLFIEESLKPSDFAGVYFCMDGSKTDGKSSNNVSKDDNIKVTLFEWNLQYNPRPGKYADNPFVIRCDLLDRLGHGILRISGWEALVRRAESKPQVKWLIDNTNICKEMFEIARENILMTIPIAFDIVKYSQKIGTKRFRNDSNQELAELIHAKSREAKKKCN